MKINIEIPESINDIKLWQYQKFIKLTTPKKGDDIDNDFVNRKALDIFYGINSKHYTNMKVKDIELVINALNKALEQKIKLIRRFEMGGIEYGIIPDFDNMTFGEFVDLDKYSELDKQHRLMSILYRPINDRFAQTYSIQPYDGSSEIMGNMPLGIALSAMDFFLTIGLQLTSVTLKSLTVTGQEQKKKRDLALSGLGTLQSTPYRVGIF